METLLGALVGAGIAGLFALLQDRLRVRRDRANRLEDQQIQAAVAIIDLCHEVYDELILLEVTRELLLKQGNSWPQVVDATLETVAAVNSRCRRIITNSGMLERIDQHLRQNISGQLANLANEAAQGSAQDVRKSALEDFEHLAAIYQRGMTKLTWQLRTEDVSETLVRELSGAFKVPESRWLEPQARRSIVQ